jgi:hypothetical protein
MGYAHASTTAAGRKRGNYPQSTPGRFVEIIEDADLLDADDREAVAVAFHDDHTPWPGLTHREQIDGYQALERLRAKRWSRMPHPPASTAAWGVWHGHKAGKSFTAVASTSRLPGTTRGSRKVQAIHAFQTIEQFRLTCEAAGCVWWFRVWADLFALPDR